jgi:hypothetical protein
MAALNAFILSGRASVIVATGPSTVQRRVVWLVVELEHSTDLEAENLEKPRSD